jgi:hypothetical protein
LQRTLKLTLPNAKLSLQLNSRYMKKLTFIILLFVACSVSALSQTKKFRVNIQTTANEKQVENDALSYLSRELRSLGDVEIVNEGELTISVTVFKIVGNQGFIGYVISFQFLENVTCQGKT